MFNKTSGVAIYSIKSVKDIYTVIIPHFCKYPLLTQKQADFILFKNILELMVQKEHLTPLGFKKVLEYKNILNKGLPVELAESLFSPLLPPPFEGGEEGGIRGKPYRKTCCITT